MFAVFGISLVLISDNVT
uniref:Uncharacterized protein n=1 Tax=Triatoma infestans TaxID=30076 RepID=A0A161MG50_TRIIF